VPIVVYDNGKTLARATLGTGRFIAHVGFRTEVGQHEHLDAALAELGVKQIEVKHQREGGSEIKRHWNLGEQLRFYPLTEGPVAPTITASCHPRAYQSTLAAGLGLRWGDNEKSKLAVRGYLEILGAAGIVEPVQLATRSRMTDRLLAALVDHGRVCEAADALRPDGLSEMVGFADLALVLGPGEEEEFGKGDTATVSPLRSVHPAEVDATYIKSIWRPNAVAEAAPRHWPEVQAWALAFGEDPPPSPSHNRPEHESAADEEPEEAPPAPAAPVAAPVAAHPSGMTLADAEQRFFARYGETVGGDTWQGVQRYLGHLLPKPTTVEGWIAIAEEVRDKGRADALRQSAASADPQQQAAAAVLSRMIDAAQRMGVEVQIAGGWERLPLEQIASHGRTLRQTMIATINGAWKAERDQGQANPMTEFKSDLQKATPEALADLHALILSRLQSAAA
jgi:hypothetical protein